MSEAKKGKKSYWWGRHLSKEHRRNIGEGNKGRVVSDETRKKIGDANSGKCEEFAPNWKGDSVKYSALHMWVGKHKGKPMRCERCNFKAENPSQIHWANKSYEYKRDLTDWLRLCVSCHKKYDKKLKD